MNIIAIHSKSGKLTKVDFAARKVTVHGQGGRKEVASFEQFVADMPFQDAPTVDQKLLKLIWKMARHPNTVEAFAFTF